MPEPTVHPEFPWSVPALVAEGVLAMLRADPHLVAYMSIIRPHETQELYQEGSLGAPELGVVLSRYAEARSGASRQATAEVELILAYVHPNAGTEAEQWLRSRVVDHIRAVLLTNGGHVPCPFATDHYAQGDLLTEALLTFGAVVAPQHLQVPDLLLTLIRCVFKSTINEATRRTLL